MSYKLRSYQEKNSLECFEILAAKKIVYLHHSPRVGKTATALQICKLSKFKNVLFLTKKKAIDSINSDYVNFEFTTFELTVINYESLHKVVGDFDCVVLDEIHICSSYPRPAQRTKLIKKLYSNLPMIMLSGTPAVESSSQWFHQFWISSASPFKQYTNFYKWSKIFVNVTQRNLGYGLINDYSNGKSDLIQEVIKDYVHTFSQADAGFTTKVEQNILYCEMEVKTISLIEKLKKDKIIQGKNDIILADTGAKMQQKIHQLFSGTVKLESGKAIILDSSKAKFIQDHFTDKKIAIFYYFVAELEMLKTIFKENLTTDLTEFNKTNKIIALQQYAGAEGISLAKADFLIFLNFGFSGSKFIQALDRLTTKTRTENNVYFIFAKGGIEEKIYKSVSKKKTYTTKQFIKDYEFSK